MDADALAQLLVSLDEATTVTVLTKVLDAKPSLAPPLVNYLVPDFTYPPSKSLTERRSTGTFKSMSLEKGFGFIDCPEMAQVFGNDVFVHSKQFNSFCSIGNNVSFAIMLNKENKPQAYDITDIATAKGKGCGGKGGEGMATMAAMLVKGKGDSWGGKGDSWGGDEWGGQGDSWGGDGWGGQGDSWGGGGGKGDMKGAFRDFMMRKMMGESPAPWGGGEASWGGKGDSWGGMGDSWGGKGEKGDKGKGKKGPSPNTGDNKDHTEAETLGSFVGHIKNFNDNTGYGFIECQQMKELGHTNDIFLHHRQLNGCQRGATVMFTAYKTNQGQVRAKDVQDVSGADPATAALMQELASGSADLGAGGMDLAKFWNEEEPASKKMKMSGF